MQGCLEESTDFILNGLDGAFIIHWYQHLGALFQESMYQQLSTAEEKWDGIPYESAIFELFNWKVGRSNSWARRKRDFLRLILNSNSSLAVSRWVLNDHLQPNLYKVIFILKV